MRPWLMVALALMGARAQAQEAFPSPSPEPLMAVPVATPAPPPAEVQVLSEAIRSPHHPQNRALVGVSTGVGLLCPDWSLPSAGFETWCTPRARLGVDFLFGDVHVGVMAGYAITVGAQFGLELGTPYFRLGKRGRGALALRTSVDGMVAAIRVDTPGRSDGGVVAFTNTYGPNFSIAAGAKSAFELRLSGGWSVAGFFGDARGFARPIYGAVADLWLAVRFMP